MQAKIKTSLLLFLLSTYGCSSGQKLDDADVLCDILTEASRLDGSHEVQRAYIEENLSQRLPASDLAEAYYALGLIEARQRAHVLKEAIDTATDDTWDCPAAQILSM